MTDNNQFAKLGALDQKLYQETSLSQITAAGDEVGKLKLDEKHPSASKLANQQTSKPTKKQTSLLANQQTSKLVLSTKEKKKYGTYLREDSILDIQTQAVQMRRKDHEILQEAIDYYFTHVKNQQASKPTS
ncbi:MAG: hypothetical protein ACRD98_03520 [Nitrososphaera sp.]